jgi:peptide/histidine transporter 3/4
VLGVVFFEVAAFYGVYLNLVVYLQDVLHGDSASNAATVGTWAGASFLMPVIGAAIADSCWGKYKTVLVGLSISLAVNAPHNLTSALLNRLCACASLTNN